jgi:hypothetical protein
MAHSVDKSHHVSQLESRGVGVLMSEASWSCQSVLPACTYRIARTILHKNLPNFNGTCNLRQFEQSRMHDFSAFCSSSLLYLILVNGTDNVISRDLLYHSQTVEVVACHL